MAKEKDNERQDMPVLFLFGIALSGGLIWWLRRKAGDGGITATLNGVLDEDGGAPTSVSFEYAGLDEVWTESPRIEASAETEFSLILPLLPETTYYFRARAENEAGTVFGETLSFQT